MPREGKAKVLTEEELKRLLKLVSTDRHASRNTALLYISFGLGLRVKEIAALSIRDVFTEAGELREELNLIRRMTKGAKQRHVYLTNPRVRSALTAYLTERRQLDGATFHPDAPLFRSQKGLRFSPNSLQQVFQRMFKSAGIEGASSHSGRRSFATTLIEKGVDIKAVSNLMGHSSIAMTAQYVEDNPARLKKISEGVL
ncbi:MAG: site-specific integrase [Gammaproteobacteria bacterium]|nr:site-specific integrase [Gammaproteobacteria bacterium]